ncbi:MAG: hypothetical protein M1838_001243 [Thelocarpon superellum]|nr:MAG: hypothetical protein M1838_001243 [Thelocarpon superellum]
MNQLPTGADLQYQLAHNDNNTGPPLNYVNGTLLGLATVSVIARLFSKKLTRVRWGYDDSLIVFGLIVSCMFSATLFYATDQGLGRHVVTLDPNYMYTTQLARYILEILSAVCMMAVKTSIMIFYHRIFPSRVFRWWVVALQIFMTLTFISGLLCIIFACTPISYYYDPKVEGHCINLETFDFVEGILTIVTDVYILVLPLPMVWKLRVYRKQKWALSIIFVLGGFVCFASASKLSMIHLIWSDDQTFTGYWPAIWSLIENNVGVFCACLPTLRPLMLRVGKRTISRRSSDGGAIADAHDQGPLPSIVAAPTKFGPVHPGALQPYSFDPKADSSDDISQPFIFPSKNVSDLTLLQNPGKVEAAPSHYIAYNPAQHSRSNRSISSEHTRWSSQGTTLGSVSVNDFDEFDFDLPDELQSSSAPPRRIYQPRQPPPILTNPFSDQYA